MKKNLLHLAVASSAAGLAMSAQAAMYINPEKTGQVLLFPYYNSENGNETSFHIVNTTEDAKAVKVRIMEYVNSQEVLDFNLYLSPEDHFAFTIAQTNVIDEETGELALGGALITQDNSCTVPELGDEDVPNPYTGTTEEKANGKIRRVQPFLPYQFADDKYDSDYRTRIGHVEVIEMGTVKNVNTTTAAYKDWMTHGADGVPANCDGLVAAWTEGGTWEANNDKDAGAMSGISAPSGGLYGISNHLNNTDAAAYGIEPAAIESFWETVGIHSDPGSVLPSLVSGDDQSLVPNGGAYYTLDFATGREVDAVSSLLMANSISNDVMVNPNLGGMTDWVVTFPTRRYYVNGEAAIAPFTDLYVATKDPNNSCEDVTVEQWDREESVTETTPGKPIFSPPPPKDEDTPLPQLCYETNTIAVNGDDAGSALNAVVSTATVAASAISVSNDNDEGWQRITFADDDHVLTVDDSDGAGVGIDGLPVMGFAAFKYVNGDAVYGFVSDHKTDVTGSALSPSS
jgi:hypothetical protein